MSWFVITAALVVFAMLAARWAVTRKGLAVTVTALLVCASLATLEGRLALREHRWSAAASELVGFEVHVHCQRMLAYAVDTSLILGYVPYDPETGGPARDTWLRRDTCDALARWNPGEYDDTQIQALHVLTHESMHMAGEADEAKAECMAVQRDAAMAQLLGADPEQALTIAGRYWTHIHRTLPSNYQSSDCGPGAPWDEGLADAPWPLDAAQDNDEPTALAGG